MTQLLNEFLYLQLHSTHLAQLNAHYIRTTTTRIFKS